MLHNVVHEKSNCQGRSLMMMTKKGFQARALVKDQHQQHHLFLTLSSRVAATMPTSNLERICQIIGHFTLARAKVLCSNLTIWIFYYLLKCTTAREYDHK